MHCQDSTSYFISNEVRLAQMKYNTKNYLHFKHSHFLLRNSYTMDCPLVRGDNQRALASGLSYIQVEKHSYTYITYISVDLDHHEIFRAKVGKGIKYKIFQLGVIH